MKNSKIFLLLILQIFILSGCNHNNINRLEDINDKIELLYIYDINVIYKHKNKKYKDKNISTILKLYRVNIKFIL